MTAVYTVELYCRSQDRRDWLYVLLDPDGVEVCRSECLMSKRHCVDCSLRTANAHCRRTQARPSVVTVYPIEMRGDPPKPIDPDELELGLAFPALWSKSLDLEKTRTRLRKRRLKGGDEC